MRLKQIFPSHFRAFGASARLAVEQDVTVITGPNDAGKTSLLRLIESVLRGSAGQEHDASALRVQTGGISWQSDPKFGATVILEVTDPARDIAQKPERFRAGDLVKAWVALAPNERGNRPVRIESVYRGDDRLAPPEKLERLPQVLWLPLEREVRDIIDLSRLNDAEQELLVMAFGTPNARAELDQLSDWHYNARLKAAADRLNEHLTRVLPFDNRLRVAIYRDSSSKDRLQFSFEDAHRAVTPLGYRGTGVRKMLTLLTTLATRSWNEDTVVLFDEPENSLHADSQHLLRSHLEALARHPRVQVIYATHSPSMLNTMRPQSIRLLRRVTVDGIPQTTIDERVTEWTYQPVRLSLGISAADSLLYGEVSVIFEGPSDMVAIGTLFERLEAHGASGFEGAALLFSRCSMIHGAGDNLVRTARIARHHGTKPVIFVDGDKPNLKSVLAEADATGGIPVVALAEGKELEDLVSRSSYFRALALVLDGDPAVLGEEKFAQWLASHPELRRKMFSKQVEEWLRETREVRLPKPRVVALCARDVPLAEVDTEPLRQLLAAIRSAIVGETDHMPVPGSPAK
ncbi:AAA family ATPase [Myxococcota bacterium]|nr:AAA family ATPase [Myxococcota bacterium]